MEGGALLKLPLIWEIIAGNTREEIVNHRRGKASCVRNGIKSSLMSYHIDNAAYPTREL